MNQPQMILKDMNWSIRSLANPLNRGMGFFLAVIHSRIIIISELLTYRNSAVAIL